MNLLYYRARKQGLSPSEAMDEIDPQGDSSPPVQTSAGPDAAPWNLPSFPAQPPPPPPPAPDAPPMVQAPNGVTGQLAAALARARQRGVMPDAINDDALAQQLQDDEKSAAQDKFTEALRAAFTRQAPNYAKAGPSAATQALMARRQTFQQGAAADQSSAFREAQLLKGEEPKPIDPTLAALHEASALQLRELADKNKTEEQRKADELKRTTTAEAASLESQRAIMAADPRLKKLGITPALLAKLDRKGLEDVAHELGPKGAGAGGPGLGKMLPADQVAQLGDYDTASKSVDDLLASHTEKGMSGLGARASAAISGPLNLNTDSNEYNDKARATAQVVGYILEGGKLSDADVPRYLRMLPQPGESPERAREKTANIHRLLQEKKAGRLKSFGAEGFRVPEAPGGGGSSGGHGKVVKETKSVRQYEDGYLEPKT